MMADGVTPRLEVKLGRLIGIAFRGVRGASMQTADDIEIRTGGGLDGDCKGLKFPRRGVTVLSRHDWETALAELGGPDGPLELPWTVRRANLFIEGVRLPRARGGIVRVGPVRLEVTYPTQPCSKMEKAHPGLLKALHPDWRGGITAAVLEGGNVRVGDEVEVVLSPPEKIVRLPG